MRERADSGTPEAFHKPWSHMSKFGIVLGDLPGFREKEGEGGSKGCIHPAKGPLAPSPCRLQGGGGPGGWVGSRLFTATVSPERGWLYQLVLEMETEAERGSYKSKVTLHVVGGAGLPFKNVTAVQVF